MSDRGREVKEQKTERMGNIVNDSALLIFVRVVTMSVSIVQTMILSRTLTKTDYGTYSQALLIISFFSPFFSLGLENAVNYFFNKSKSEKERQKFINTIFSLSAFCGIVGGIILFLFRNQIVEYFGNSAVAPLMIYVAFRPCIQNLVTLYQPVFISSGYAKTIAIRNLIISIVQICIVGGVSYYINDIALILLLLLIADLIQLMCFVVIYGKKRFWISLFHPSLGLVQEILTYSLPMLLSSSIGTISLNIDKLMVSGLMSTEDYALYSNVSKELPFAFISNAFTAVVTPHIVKYINNGEDEKFKNLWSHYLELGYKITWPLCIGAALLAPELIEILYSQTYLSQEGIAVFQFYTIAAMMRFTYFGMIPSALGKTKVILKYSIVGCIVNVCLNYPMFLCMGMSGPALATVISLVVSAVLYLRESSKLVDIPIVEILAPKRIVILILEMCICGVAVRMLISLLENYFSNVFISFVLGYSIFIALIFGVNYKQLKMLISDLKKGE